MKITFVAKPNSIKFRALYALVSECQLRETNRTVIGTNEDNLVLVVTFEGQPDHYKLFNNEHYVWFPTGTDLISPQVFYSLDCMDGFTGYIDGFKKHKEQLKKQNEIIIKKL